uniref:PIPK domain-containing protein n=1 Tax=Arcella intermedia TaxID=1963864 RepID=A0A6B2LC72_9EUKA
MEIRKTFGVSEQEILKSFLADDTKHQDGEGKSGALMIFSKDSKFVIKTISDSEFMFMVDFCQKYSEYLKQNPNSLLVKIYACFESDPYNVLLMQNVCSPDEKGEKGEGSWERFDLKGSLLGRTVKPKDRTEVTTLKDVDFLELNKKIPLPVETYNLLLNQIEQDCNFLSSYEIMDYSLLIGIYYSNSSEICSEGLITTNTSSDSQITRSCYFSRLDGCVNPISGKKEVYYLGIIDYLIVYTEKKKIETFFKTLASETQTISAINPILYAQRFNKFMSDNVFLLLTDH